MMLIALAVTVPVLGQSASSPVTNTAKNEIGTTSTGPASSSQPAANAPNGKSSEGNGTVPSTDKAASSQTSNTVPGNASSGATPPSPSSAAPPANLTPTGMDGATYQVRLRDLEQRIDELKEQIRRSHTRLSLLSETILSGGTGGARAEITFINDMSSAFRMTQALFVLDGAVQYNKQDETGLLAGQKEIPIFSGSIPPGDHTLQVLLKLRGHGYGVFSYLQGYRFEIRSSHSFTVTEGKTIELKAIAFEKGDVTTPIEQRPAVRYHKNVRAGAGIGASPNGESKGGTSDAPSSVSVSVGSK
jgi:hypothetical protein